MPLSSLPAPRYALPVALLALLLVLPALALPAPPAPDTSRLDVSLVRTWSTLQPDDRLRVIIQFESTMTDEDWLVLRGLGYEMRWRYTVIHGTAGWLSAEGVAKLSHYERTWWIERDDLGEYYMDQSVQTIRADSTWQRIVRDATGAAWEEDDVELPVDGSGVTVVVADTGIDATHPDLDYREKVIENKKADVDGQPWVELINTDNLFGHGTHCAGTVAGTGEASAGMRRGVAPGASLIGLGIGDPWESNEVGAFDWVYEHAAPPNPRNIRVITNSWGYESVDEYWKDAVLQASQRMSYERNVVVTFAASNDGGDGSESRTNIYGNSPGMISVAAAYREGGGIAGFSSRGDRTDNSTWPDVAAPGVEIWSTRDSTGFIVNAVAGDTNIYYTAISGTSMATPHMAGVVALLWQAAPSLRFSRTVDDRPVYDDAYLSNSWSYIHETELILKLTADFLNSTGGNGVPGENEMGVVGRDHDFAQGYGQVNAERAVALALALEELRRTDSQATVWDALPLFEHIIAGGLATQQVNGARQQVAMFREPGPRAASSWFGEYIVGPNVAWGQSHDLFVPQETAVLVLDFHYDQMNYDQGQVGELDLFVEAGGSGVQRLTLPDLLSPDGHKRVELATDLPPLANLPRDTEWQFTVSGYATRVEYLVDIGLVFDADVTLEDPTLRPAQIALDDPVLRGLGYEDPHNVRVATKYFDLRNLHDPPPVGASHTLTVTSPDEGAELAVYRTGQGDVALAVGPSPLMVTLPEDWYYVRATLAGHWPGLGDDLYLDRDRTLAMAPLAERDVTLPHAAFVAPRAGDDVSGKVNIRLQLDDTVGLSSVQFSVDGALRETAQLEGRTSEVVEFTWDSTENDDGDVTLALLVVDSDSNTATTSITVKVDNDDDLPVGIIAVSAGVLLLGVAAWTHLRRRKTHGWRDTTQPPTELPPGIGRTAAPAEPLDAEPVDEPGDEN